MPNINEFIGPKPEQENINNLEKIIGIQPCSKCELDSKEYYWTCKNGHLNNIKVNS
jgi:hypothetical protein